MFTPRERSPLLVLHTAAYVGLRSYGAVGGLGGRHLEALESSPHLHLLAGACLGMATRGTDCMAPNMSLSCLYRVIIMSLLLLLLLLVLLLFLLLLLAVLTVFLPQAWLSGASQSWSSGREGSAGRWSSLR